MNAPHTQKMRNYGLKALLCTRIAFPYTTRELDINSIAMGGAIRNERKDQARLELRR